MATKNKLDFTKAPALPLTPVSYSRQYQDQLNTLLRLYFNQIDNQSASLLAPAGGFYLSFPHIAAQDTTDQYTTNNTATKVLWNTLDSGLGFTLNANSTATAEYTGVYKIDYSLQFVNTVNNVVHDVWVWLQIDGVDLPGSGSKFSIAGKHSGANGNLVAYSSITFAVEAGQSIGLYWATNQAYIVSPATDGVYMQYTAASSSPFAMPSIPSAIGSIVFVSGVTA